MDKNFKYDVFLSHNSYDKPRVRRLAERLKRSGLRVWFDEWCIPLGGIISIEVDNGLEQSRVLVLCISPTAIASAWVSLERSTAIHRDPTNEGRRFIPILLAHCDLPDALKRYKYLNYSDESDLVFNDLLNACSESSRELSHAEINILSIENSIYNSTDQPRFEIVITATNNYKQSFGWSGLTISVPTINSHELFHRTQIEVDGDDYESPTIYEPGSRIWRFHELKRPEEFPSECLLVESLNNLWQPDQTIFLRLVVIGQFEKINFSVRAWANYARGTDWTDVIGDPIWQSGKRRDQQGVPAYWHSITSLQHQIGNRNIPKA